MEIPEWVKRKKAEEFGGADDDYEEYDNGDPAKRHYSDKGGHRERGLYHRPKHAEHYKKQGDDISEV